MANKPEIPELKYNDMTEVLSQLARVVPGYWNQIGSEYYDRDTMPKTVSQIFWIAKQNLEITQSLQEQYSELWNFVNDYFNNLDVQEEINNTLNEMAKNGTLSNIINSYGNFIFVGDSYGVGNSFFAKFANILGLSSDKYNNLSVSGTGFNKNNENGFLSQLQSFSGDKDSITDIIVCGGANDAENRTQSNHNDLISAIEQFSIYVKKNFKYAKIYIGYIGGCLKSSNYYNTHTYENNEWALYCYKDRSVNFGMTYLTNIDQVMHATADNYGTDGLHPSEVGQNSLARGLYESYKKSLTSIYPIIKSGLQNMYYSNNGNIVEYTLKDNTIINLNQNIIGNTFYEIGELNTVVNEAIILTNYAIVQGGDKNNELIHIILKLEGKRIYFKSIEISEDGTGYKNITGNSLKIILLPFTIITKASKIN